MRKSSILILLWMVMYCMPVFAADVSGEWAIKMFSPTGAEETYNTTIKVNGEALDIGINHPQFGDIKGTGTLKGDKITIEFSVQGGDGGQTFQLEGEVKGDKMEGTRKLISAVDPSAMMGGGSGGGAPPGGGSDNNAPPGGEGGAPGGGSGGSAPAGGSSGGADSFAASHFAKFPDSKYLPGQEPNTWTGERK